MVKGITMSDMKCPICNKPMKQATYDYDKKDNDDTLYMSIMPCDCLCNFAASKAVWQELIRTRKALDVAVDALKMIGSGDIIEHSVVGHEDDNKIFIANNALEQITALEQKDK